MGKPVIKRAQSPRVAISCHQRHWNQLLASMTGSKKEYPFEMPPFYELDLSSEDLVFSDDGRLYVVRKDTL